MGACSSIVSLGFLGVVLATSVAVRLIVKFAFKK